jgi:Antirestriction protein
MDINVYIANLGKYNEGELVGAWFQVPVDFEEVKERIGLNAEYEEYAIHDYEAPIPISEFTSISEINRIGEMLEELDGTEIIHVLKEIMNTWFRDIEELLEHKEDIICHSDCNSMEDVARYYLEESNTLGEIPSDLQGYFDYEAYGRDLEISGNFLITNHGIFEYCN